MFVSFLFFLLFSLSFLLLLCFRPVRLLIPSRCYKLYTISIWYLLNIFMLPFIVSLIFFFFILLLLSFLTLRAVFVIKFTTMNINSVCVCMIESRKMEWNGEKLNNSNRNSNGKCIRMCPSSHANEAMLMFICLWWRRVEFFFFFVLFVWIKNHHLFTYIYRPLKAQRCE